jgi:hypothetical protein
LYLLDSLFERVERDIRASGAACAPQWAGYTAQAAHGTVPGEATTRNGGRTQFGAFIANEMANEKASQKESPVKPS